MKNFINSLYLLITTLIGTGCSNDERFLNMIDSNSDFGEIECRIDAKQASMSRTYYEHDDYSNAYKANWDMDDQIIMCFDDADNGRKFKILSGENSASAVFYGPLPDVYKEITAIYPYDIFSKRTPSSIELHLPSTINYNAQKILCGAMPMYAHGIGKALNFYNLMGVMKISVQGKGLLRSISVNSIDGYGLSGPAKLIIDENEIPQLSFTERGRDLTINLGAILLSDKGIEFYLPIPAMTYDNGLKLEFEFEGGRESRELRQTLYFDRSVMRAIKPYEIDVPFDFDNYEIKDNEIWYKSDIEQSITPESNLDASLVSQSFSSKDQLGVITTDSPIVKIGGPIFSFPKSIFFVKLPNSLQEIATSGLRNTSIESFEAPQSLRILGTDAFLGCSKLKSVILNDGCESLGLEVFGDCPNIEYAYIPQTVQIIGAYSFRGSTENLDHWDGDCTLIDNDRHALYSNSVYGMVASESTTIDIIAGCNLIEYRIPDKALFTQNYALSGCKKLKKLIIHEKFLSFGLIEIPKLRNLETIECYANRPPVFNPDEEYSTNSLKVIRVPQESIEQYKTADGWKNFSDKIIAM